MRFLLRSLFVWMMVLALPLQGVAAAGMQACGSMHAPMGPNAVAAEAQLHGPAVVEGHRAPVMAHGDAHAIVHGEAHSIAHGEADPIVHGDAHAAAPTQFASDPGAPIAGHQCGACAACCPAVALPSVPSLPAAPVAGVAAIPASPARATSFVPPGLERPPRAVLA